MPGSKTIGSRLQVYRGDASHTSGGLTKNDLTKNRRGKIVSKKQSMNAKRHSNLPELIRKS